MKNDATQFKGDAPVAQSVESVLARWSSIATTCEPESRVESL